MRRLFLILTVLQITKSIADSKKETKSRVPRILSMFNVVEFPNSACLATTNRNGTCYTAEECENKGGMKSGSCAQGFGTCCIFELSCGDTTSENCSYLTLEATTTMPEPMNCQYTICKLQNNVCRLRFDLDIFEIQGPVTATTVAAAQATTSSGIQGSVGDCVTDVFSVASSGTDGTPSICGFNSGQHCKTYDIVKNVSPVKFAYVSVFVDASNDCSIAQFTFNTATGMRQYDIKVTQYECGSEMGGPPGCLQYFTGDAGNVASFNFPVGKDVIATTTHLSSQLYNICFRRGLNQCSVCFIPSISASNGVAKQASFGLTISGIAITANSQVDAACQSDYILIPLSFIDLTTTGQTAIVPVNEAGANMGSLSRLCGRFFGYAAGPTAVTASVSVCTNTRPFMITFRTDQNEVFLDAPGGNVAMTSEESLEPGGIVGFNLNFQQKACA